MDGEEIRDKVQNSDPATEPIDLAQAFKMYNQANRTPAQEPVADEPDAGQDAQVAGGEGAEPVGEPAVEDEPAVTVGDGAAGGADIDGPADVIEPIDYNPARQQILKDVQNRAIDEVRREFAQQEISMWSINDIYERDEQTGRVRFRNPDDPNRDFSSRYEAQQFVDAMNKQISTEFRQRVNMKQRELIQQEGPRLRTLEFAPRYNAMDQTTKDIFDDLIEPYAVRDGAGDVIGFNVNLEPVARQAERIAARFKQQAPAAPAAAVQEKEKPTGPALDMKTGASVTGDAEPKTIGEALKMYDKKQRESKKKGK